MTARIRLCPCGAPPLDGPWCAACARDRRRRREPLDVVAWNSPELD